VWKVDALSFILSLKQISFKKTILSINNRSSKNTCFLNRSNELVRFKNRLTPILIVVDRFLKNTCLLGRFLKHALILDLFFIHDTVKWGESGLAGRVGTKFRSSKTETQLHEQTFWFSEALRRSIENSLCTTENSPVQSILCFQGSKLRPNSPRQSRFAPLYCMFLLWKDKKSSIIRKSCLYSVFEQTPNFSLCISFVGRNLYRSLL